MTNPTPVAIFRDTVQPGALALPDYSFDGVIAYANGGYEWQQEQIERFVAAGKRLHKYDTNATGVQHADVLDVERFDADPTDVPGWVDERWKTHSTAAVYCDRTTVPEVVSKLGARSCYLIVADWTGTPHIPELELPPHIVLAGVQYASYSGYDAIAIYSRAWLEGAKIA